MDELLRDYWRNMTDEQTIREALDVLEGEGADAASSALDGLVSRLAETEKVLRLLLDTSDPTHRIPGVNPDGSVSAAYTMAQVVARAALDRAGAA